MRFLVVLCLLFVPALFSQDAKVIPLNPVDTRRAEKLYQEMKDAKKSWQDFQDQVKKDYLTVDRNDPDASSNSSGSFCIYQQPCQYFRSGFDGGNFIFSSDFKFIVPKPVVPITNPPCDYWHQGTSCFILNSIPATNLTW